jgi:FkbM family methyltransferase
MTWTSALRVAAISRLPKSWRPAATYHYYRARSRLDRELPVVCRALRAGVVAVDVGANEGVYTHAFARTGAIVEAFEPQPDCLQVLRSYVRRHANVHVRGEALGAADTEGRLRVPLRDGRAVSGWANLRDERQSRAEPAVEHKVQIRTLDSFAFRNVAVIKIDVEGFELDVMRGARQTIATWRPLLLVELEQRHHSEPLTSAFDQFTALGYAGVFVEPRGGMRPLSEFELAIHQPLANADVPGATYVNNFIFMPHERSNAATAEG